MKLFYNDIMISTYHVRTAKNRESAKETEKLKDFERIISDQKRGNWPQKMVREWHGAVTNHPHPTIAHTTFWNFLFFADWNSSKCSTCYTVQVTRRMNFRITSTIAYQVHQQRPHIACIAGFLGPSSWKKNGSSAPKCHFCDPDRRSRWCGQQTYGWGSLLAANSTPVAALIVSCQNSWVLQSIEKHIHRLMDDRCYTICFCATLWTGIYMFIYIYIYIMYLMCVSVNIWRSISEMKTQKHLEDHWIPDSPLFNLQSQKTLLRIYQVYV